MTNYEALTESPEALAAFIGDRLGCFFCPVGHCGRITRYKDEYCRDALLEWLKRPKDGAEHVG